MTYNIWTEGIVQNERHIKFQIGDTITFTKVSIQNTEYQLEVVI
jgi:hypothetical protein